MKTVLILLSLVVVTLGKNVAQNQTQRVPTLNEDLEQLQRLIFTKELKHLVRRYLLNDAEFQGVVRVINSPNAFFVSMRLRSEPEIIEFKAWLAAQRLLYGESGELSSEDSDEIMNIFNPTPYWANTVTGWAGFMREFQIYYQQPLLHAHIASKLQPNRPFAQFWTRLIALKPVYERVLLYPETQQLLTQLQELGIDTNQIDHFIRSQFNWLPAKPVEPAAQAA